MFIRTCLRRWTHSSFLRVHENAPTRNYSSSTPSSSCEKLAPNESQPLTLPSGATLGFSTYGSSSGQPLFLFHGLPGSRLDARGWDAVGRKLNARIIGVDRPGMGLSSPHPGRKLLDWPETVLSLARHLGLDTFRILGGHGGGPYAIACAHVIPKDILRATGVLYGPGPIEAGLKGMGVLNYLAWKVLPAVPWLERSLTYHAVIKHVQNPDPNALEGALQRLAKHLSAEEQRVVLKEEYFMNGVDSLREAFRQGTTGYEEDLSILQHPWGFPLTDVDANKILLWYGNKDTNAPLHFGRYMAERLRNSTLKIYKENTPFTLGDEFEEEIMAMLLEGEG